MDAPSCRRLLLSVALALSSTGLLGTVAAAGGQSLGRGGIVAPGGRIGKLRIDVSTPADIRRFGGAPAFAGRGTPSAGAPSIPSRYQALGYACSRRRPGSHGLDPGGARAARVWCRTIYFVNPRTGKLAGFWTDSRAFRTDKGTRPGMREEVADRLEGRHPYVHALTGIDRSTRRATLFIENRGCKPGPNLNTSPCLGGVVRNLIVEGRHPVGLLEDGIPNA